MQVASKLPSLLKFYSVMVIREITPTIYTFVPQTAGQVPYKIKGLPLIILPISASEFFERKYILPPALLHHRFHLL